MRPICPHTLISILYLTLAGSTLKASAAAHPCEIDDQAECTQVTQCNRLQQVLNYWSESDFIHKPIEINFNIHELLKKIEEHPDALDAGRLILRSRRAMIDPCPVDVVVGDSVIVPHEYAQEYFRVINTVSMNIQSRALLELSFPIEEQRERINELDQLINSLPASRAESFGPSLDQYSAERRVLVNEYNRYYRIMGVSRWILKKLNYEITRFHESFTAGEFETIMNRSGLHSNEQFMKLKEDQHPTKGC
ncbi:MAG: hypothetical protein JJ974_03875 [Phycisphaerales bacterium]|nr:hypothetical protein [Phycisphaerales bacterium]